jgi:hypothetical protein
MYRLNLKPTHKAVQNYYQALKEFESLGVSHEGAVRSAFQSLLEDCGKRFGWKLVPEWIRRDKTRSIRIDGALVDEYRLPHGFWEAKDTHDDLAKEVKKKINAGYSEQPSSRAIAAAISFHPLIQNRVSTCIKDGVIENEGNKDYEDDGFAQKVLNIRTGSGPGSPRGQPAWGGGCDRPKTLLL